MQKIFPMDPLLANQIAAGEVVERPASVVKELFENSLDAGATHIDLTILQGGLELIKVRDNGEGIQKDDLPLAISPHATSKIRSLKDLQHVLSLGFRGEALASVASISKLTLKSRTADQENGWMLTAAGTLDPNSIQPTAHPQGTTVEIHELFFNTPARRKFMRTEKTEFGHIETVFKRLALSSYCFPVSFTMTHNQRTTQSLRVATTPTEKERRIAAICGNDFIQNALSIEFAATGLKLWGWLGSPDFGRKQNDLQYFYVNGRIIKDKIINHAIRLAYRDSHLGEQLYPSYVLYLELDPASMDVNVHPTKHEVRFHQSRLIHDFISSSLYKVISGDLPIAGHTHHPEITVTEHANSLNSDGFIAPTQNVVQSEHTQAFSNPNLTTSEKEPALTSSHDQNIYQTTAESKTNLTENLVAEPPRPQTQHKLEIPTEHQLGQALTTLHERYILSEDESGLIIIDSITTQKAITLNQLQKEWSQDKINSQPLLFPASHTLCESKVSTLQTHRETLNQLGVELEALSNTEIVVRRLPTRLGITTIPALLEALGTLLTSIEQANEHTNDILILLAQHSVPPPLSKDISQKELDRLLRKFELFSLENTQITPKLSSNFCKRISLTELESLFKAPSTANNQSG